jgi:hypothetical protein
MNKGKLLDGQRLLNAILCIMTRTDLVLIFRNNICFYGEELLPNRSTPKLEDHSLSAVRDCLFNIFAATLHFGGRSFIRSLRTRHAVATGTQLSRYGPHTRISIN